MCDIVFIMHAIKTMVYDIIPLCVWHHTPLCITSHPAYLWHHIQYICYHHNAFMTTQRLFLASHPPYLTSQPLDVCHHTDGTHICIDVSLYRRHHNKCVSHHTWHTCHIMPNLNPIPHRSWKGHIEQGPGLCFHKYGEPALLTEQYVSSKVWADEKTVDQAQNAVPVIIKLKDPHLFSHQKQYSLKPEVNEWAKSYCTDFSWC